MAKSGGLTAQGVKNAGPGVHGDGDGLYLRVKSDGRASWTLRYQLAGRRRDLGLGRARGAGAVTLADARRKAEDARRLIGQGRDPLDVRDAEQSALRAAEAALAKMDETSFETVTRAFLDAKGSSWRNAKHADQWANTLTTYAFPFIGGMAVDRIGVPDIVKVLQPIWTSKPETGGRVRGRIEAVLAYAAALDLRPKGFNPATWRGNLDAVLPPLGKAKMKAREAAGRGEHHPALPWAQMAPFMRAATARDGMAPIALRFAVLSAGRTGEVLGATWEEIDGAGKVWTIPSARMKGGEQHRVPLSDAALAVLEEAAARTGRKTGLVFAEGERRLSDMSLTMAVRRMQGDGAPRWTDEAGNKVVPHGFRSTFRDWVAENLTVPREVAERCLAHVVGSKTEVAYRRNDALELRRPVMAAWAAWCAGEAAGADVVPLRRTGTAAAEKI